MNSPKISFIQNSSIWEKMKAFLVGKETLRKRKSFWVMTIILTIGFSGTAFLFSIIQKRKQLPEPFSTVLGLSSHQDSHHRKFKNVKGLRICCSTIGTLFVRLNEATTAKAATDTVEEPLRSKSFEVISSGVGALLKLITQNDVYLITQVETDEEEHEIRRLLDETGILWAGLSLQKVLFSQTAEGRVHMSRQLDTHFHIDDNPEVISMLKAFVPQLLYITKDRKSAAAQLADSNIATAEELAQFLAIPAVSR